MPDRSALISRLATLPEAGLGLVENAILRAEAAIPATPGATRVVSGATIMDRPDLMPVGTAVIGGPAPSGEPARPAEVAQGGVTRR